MTVAAGPHPNSPPPAGEGDRESRRDEDVNRLRWRCRRGMLELDAALLAFLERDYRSAAPDLQQAFEALLAMDDGDVLTFMMADSAPASPLQARLHGLLTRPLPGVPG